VFAALAMAGHRVLACDLDPQSNLTMGSGINIDSVERAMPQVLVTRRCTLAEVVQSTPLGYDIAPADPDSPSRTSSSSVRTIRAGSGACSARCSRCAAPTTGA
jgi:cellulose biosynthesis protein BcsQ